MFASIWHRYLTATRNALFEQARNRTALILLIAFVPIWDYLFWLVVPAEPLSFLFQTTGVFLQVNGRNLTLLTAGLNAITLIIGFMLFTSTRKNTQFDRRLVLSGYSQVQLILAKLTALVVVSAIIALYTTLVLLAFWRPGSFFLVWLGFFCSALGYGALGLLLGFLVRGELEGFFLIIMISLMDTSLQNPFGNPIANQPFLKWFPSYAPMQFVVAGAFNQTIPWLYLLYSLAWPLGFALLGFAIFLWKTRAWSVQVTPPSPSTMATS
ncbi:MAG TPA: ABC transporter permease [Ktedonobacteraceae bacterium]|nr:ABC transporter permease [Ktedonobacteraceae bacterium]